MIKIPLPNSETLWEDESHGIRHEDEFKKFDSRGKIEAIKDFSQAQFHGLQYTFSAGLKRLCSAVIYSQPSQFDDNISIGKTGSLGLIILFHGLNGQPSLWDSHVAYFANYPSIDVSALAIPNGGNCSLEEDSFDCLLERIVDWIKRNPLKPVALFGQSNGTRVAANFEVLLRKNAPETPIHLSLTGGVLYGSATVSALAFDKLNGCKGGYNVYEDLSYGSEVSKELLKEMREPLSINVASRFYTFYAPFHDHHVHATGSALPIINPECQKSKKERHFLVFNYGHNAIPLSISQNQVATCIKWMNKHLQRLETQKIIYSDFDSAGSI